MNTKKLPLKNVIKDIINQLEKGQKEGPGELITAWGKALDKVFSEHTRLVTLKSGRLIVNVSDSSRLYELTLKRREIIKNLNKHLKKKKIKEIRFKIGEV